MNATDLCNLALSLIGESANVSAIDPPEKSVQAEQCARFYPIALSSLLESHPWTFATKRERLARLSADAGKWRFAYARPSDCIRVLGVVCPGDFWHDGRRHRQGLPVAVDPAIHSEYHETGRIGDAPVILTDTENAELRYITGKVDTGMFSALFKDALVLRLASHLAGSLIKGDAGMRRNRELLAEYRLAFSLAAASDSNQKRLDMDFIPEPVTRR